MDSRVERIHPKRGQSMSLKRSGSSHFIDARTTTSRHQGARVGSFRRRWRCCFRRYRSGKCHHQQLLLPKNVREVSAALLRGAVHGA